METIIIKLDAQKMKNPDSDIRYALPNRIEEYSNNQITDNGYDYISNSELALWFETDNAEKNVELIIQLLSAETFFDNDLSNIAEIYISDKKCADLEDCRKIYG
ncbi:MAG: hypothetical protein K2K91_04835 [Ruminococcus sp.]|nr:hypothetical protein [Ruminococcus sp.]